LTATRNSVENLYDQHEETAHTMLKYMRENAGSWGIRAIFVILVLAFIGWGGGGISDFFQGTDDLAASVNGTTIKRADYENRARRLLQTYRSQYRAILKKDITPQMELEYKKSLLERMIERELLLQTIDEMGLAISNSAVSEAIKAEDSFKDEKTQQFSYELYTRLLRANQLTPEAYELERRRDLLIEQLRTSVEDFVKDKAPEVAEFVTDGAKTIVEKVSGKSPAAKKPATATRKPSSGSASSSSSTAKS